MEKLVILNCINFQREQIGVEGLPCAGHRSKLSFPCSTVKAAVQRPVSVEVQTDDQGITTAHCQETELCKDVQTFHD